MDGFKKFVATLTSPHYKMERFCATFVIFVTLLGLIFGASLNVHMENQKMTLGSRAKYTQSAQWSLSGEGVTVVDIYRNENYTKAFMLLQVSSMTNLSSDAKDYKIFLTNYDRKKPLQCKPKASIYMFGNTGYMGLYFVDDSGFKTELCNIVVRNTRMLVKGDRERAASIFPDPSFVDNNQIQLFANFAGSDGKIVKFLNSPEPTVRDIYMELFSEDTVNGAKSAVNQALLNMNTQMALINEYANRLDKHNLLVPALPSEIAGDYVTTSPDLTIGNPREFDPSMLSGGSSESTTKFNVTIDSSDEKEAASYVEGDVLYFVTDYVFPGGIQYNHQDLTLTGNYLDTMKPSDLTYTEWRASKTAEASQYRLRNVSFDKWMNKDGTYFAAEDFDQSAKTIQTDINVYETAVKTLYQLKQNYQREQLFAILFEDAKSSTVTDMFSIRSDPDTIRIY